MFVPVPLPSEMARWDAFAVERGLPAAALMENAAREALTALRAQYGPLDNALVHLYMGGGNNGGDAACLARHLLDAGARPVVFCTRPLNALRGEARLHARLARALGVRFVPAESRETFSEPDIIVDGLLGTGFCGTLREKEARLVERINARAGCAFILALDVPSGLCAATGKARPGAVRADLTVAFAAAKPGLLLPEAAPWVGRLEVRPIGMPRAAEAEIPASYRLWRGVHDRTLLYAPIEDAARPGAFAPATPFSPAHKGEAGRVLICGGSRAYPGAPCLAARGALRGGAGLVGAILPEAARAVLAADLPEAVLVPLPAPEFPAEWPSALPETLLDGRWGVILVGPGMGRNNGAEEFVAALLRAPSRPPLVLDADALGILAARPELLALLRPEDVLTPHPGEAAALLGQTPRDVQADRFAALAGLAALAPAVWVLKGAGTLIHVPGEAAAICPLNVPHLAVAGSGDVLAGLLATLISRGAASGDAACRAVHQHALAGIWLARAFPGRGHLARDIADALPRAADPAAWGANGEAAR